MSLDLSLTNHVDWESFSGAVNLTDLDIGRIKQAFDFAKVKHSSQKRESGQDYITHPAWVAKIIAQLNLGEEAIMASLLHDCIEDTNTTLTEMSNVFGDEIALLVDGLTEVKRKTKDIALHDTNVEVFRHFLFSSVDDVRVLIIRIVDKLHNGLTIGALSQPRQIKYAKRVFGIYGPVAEYVGLHYFKRIIEDIAFEILYPEESLKLKQALQESSKHEIKALTLINSDITNLLDFNNINDYEIQTRIKSLYSTYQKIKKKGQTGLKDRVGIRIITQNITDCYMVLGLLHSKYQYLPDEFDDYISKPKPSGYRSLQTAIQWKNNITAEIQIRTKDMHDFNEFGPASHIAYKMSRKNTSSLGYEWVRDLVKWQKNDKNVKNYRIDVLTKYIYVFTPKGDTLQLPSGSTALDFAYRVHTDIGDHCYGAKVNNKMTKIDTELKTGDLVEIQTNNKLNVNRNWIRIVKTRFAKEHIRKMTNLDQQI